MKRFAIITFTNYIYFRSISLPRSLLYELNIVIFFNTGLLFTPEVVTMLYKTMARKRGLGPWIFHIHIDLFKLISLFGASSSFGLRKQSSQKSWTKLLKTFSKNLEKYVWMNSFLEPATLLTTTFLRYFLGFCLSFRGLLSRNTSLDICSYSKEVVNTVTIRSIIKSLDYRL